MATITKRMSAKGPRYTVQVRCSGVRTTKTFGVEDGGKAAAQRWASEIERAARLADQGLGPLAVEFSRGMTLRQAVDRYVTQVLPGLETGAEVAAQLEAWCELLGPEVALRGITTSDIIGAREQLRGRRKVSGRGPGKRARQAAPLRQEAGAVAAGGRAPGSSRTGAKITAATVNRYLAALRRMLNVAVREWQVIKVNPAAAVSSLREPGGRVRWLTDSERGKLLAACEASPNPDLLLAVLISLCTAVRRGELLALEWRDVDLGDRLLTVRAEIAKTNKSRVLPLAGRVVGLLEARAARPHAPGEKLFTLPVSRLRSAFLAATTAAKITDFRWHDLRHTAASYLAMQGASPREIAEFTGHQTMAMVMRYTHISDSHARGLADRLAERVFEKRGIGVDGVD